MTTTARPACGVALLLLSLSIRAWAWALPHQRSFALSKSRLGARMLPIDEPKKSSAQVLNYWLGCLHARLDLFSSVSGNNMKNFIVLISGRGRN